jgi:hypothetical protein
VTKRVQNELIPKELLCVRGTKECCKSMKGKEIDQGFGNSPQMESEVIDSLIGAAELKDRDFRAHIEANAEQVAYTTADVHTTVP